MTSLSIIIPTFRRTDSLGRLLEALSKQEGVTPEVIVVDQNPEGFLDEVFLKAPFAKRLRLSKPNVSDARNKGFLQSSGKVVLFIDDDLIPEPGFCRQGLEVLDKYKQIDCFSPLVYNIEGKEAALQHAKRSYLQPLDAAAGIFAMTDTLSAALFFRREYYEQTGGFDPILFEFAKTAEDQELFLRMRSRNQTLYFVPSVEVFHDEGVPGGCDLRTVDYWITREKCMKSWAFRYRIHHHPPGNISTKDLLKLARSSFLNREGLTSGIGNFTRQVSLLRKSIKASGDYLKNYLGQYTTVEKISHLK
ncbi:MAG: glycosyltransferase family 2 protein [Bacteroidetes bacterium]|nr:glycosyltransferase family 2 protein [Bacteroidota bacterium]